PLQRRDEQRSVWHFGRHLPGVFGGDELHERELHLGGMMMYAPRGRAGGASVRAVLAAVALFEACSPEQSHPPVDTNGGGGGSSVAGGGGGSSSEDAGTTESDAATPDEDGGDAIGVEAGSCTPDNCVNGCCDTQGNCQTAITNAVCGILGSACKVCE